MGIMFIGHAESIIKSILMWMSNALSSDKTTCEMLLNGNARQLNIYTNEETISLAKGVSFPFLNAISGINSINSISKAPFLFPKINP